MRCPICESLESKQIKIRNQDAKDKLINALQCKNCSSIFVEDYQKDRSYLYDKTYSPWSLDKESVISSKIFTFKKQLLNLLQYINPENKKLLDCGCAKGYLMTAAQELGFDVYGFDISKSAIGEARKKFKNTFCGTIEKAKYKKEFFEVIIMADILEHLPEPDKFMKNINRILKPNSLILIMTPNADSLTRKILGKNWYQFKEEHIIYYSKKGITNLLKKNGFEILFLKANTKTFSLEYTNEYLKKYKIFLVSKLFNKVYALLPKKAKIPNIFTGESLIIARKSA